MPTPSATPREQGVTGDSRPTTDRLGVVRLLRTRGYRRLLAVRFATQWGDGLFQAALGASVLFNPQRQADPLAVAAGLAVLLLPYSLVSPFAGALLDRWDRRLVLTVANLAKAAIIPLVALLVLAGNQGPLFYVGALVVAGIGRFALAGLSASLPHVVPKHNVVEANTLAVTIGTGMSALGAGSAVGLRHVFGGDDAGSAATMSVSILGAVVAALIAVRFSRERLGPDQFDEHPQALIAVARGLLDGAKASLATPTVTSSFFALGCHRLAFGISTLLTLLLYRYAFVDEGVFRAGLEGIGEALACTAAGLVLAAVVTPALVRWIGRTWTVRAALIAAVLSQVVVAALLSMPAVLAGAFVIGMTGQIVKLCTDAAVQSEVRDAALGRVFALYDVVFNVGYVIAVTVTALLSPPDGRAPLLLGAAALLYVVGYLGHDLLLLLRRRKAS
ncbi:MFS transporter [Pseudonocardia thermophila]|uniref:MFS transporter n=1 Tax=Pseudonocardia thermophila TaxID=1848 RepID=UPI001F19F080|nr:MFS transporter [Pseudonocardia thermophila]